MPQNLIIEGTVKALDPIMQELIERETARQQSTIILIPSESVAPPAVNEALGSAFGNIYAEGYPREDSRRQTEAEIADFAAELAHYRRNSDPRYYKGVEYADQLEALARRRAAELFADNGVSPDDLYVNVQPLSGGPANSQAYAGILEPGDIIMGMNLNDGGHLSHGSRVNRSGKLYNSVPYNVPTDTEKLDYDAIEAQAVEVIPNLIVAGFTAYPFVVDWARFRAIADKVGAYLLADISHISGLVAAGEHPSPIGIADVVMSTTHKSLCGPRGAMLLTHKRQLAHRIDRAVFPGEQGGPHLNSIAGIAVALRLAKTDAFKALQQRVRRNAKRLAEQLQARGIRVVGGGTENHLLLLDMKGITHGEDYLTGDMAARILDVAGIVTNRNTIPGDPSAFRASGVRLGTVWISQLGFGDAEIDKLAEAIATLLQACTPFAYTAAGSKIRRRAKVDWETLQQARKLARELTNSPDPQAAGDTVQIRGKDSAVFLDYVVASNVPALADGDSQAAQLGIAGKQLNATLKRIAPAQFQLRFASVPDATLAAIYLADLSDGYIQFSDLHAKLPGPVVVSTIAPPADLPAPGVNGGIAESKPFFIGSEGGGEGGSLPAFAWEEPADAPLRQTGLWARHKELGAKMAPFGGWDMPVWYSSVSEEHNAVRQAAGLFDVTHMGVLEASGAHAAQFLETVSANEIGRLKVGRSHYTYLLLPDGGVVDDLLIYRRAEEVYLLVVNAANNDKDWAWLTAVNEGRVAIDNERPWAKIQNPCRLRDLRQPEWGAERLVDVALQGPASRDILLAMCDDDALAGKIKKMGWAGLAEGRLGEFYTVISRTGYTGERVAYELFVHPDQLVPFWDALLDAGKPFGIAPCGLAARDSLRTEAGLPLYGHELAGDQNLSPGDAGFASFVKVWKPFFIGRSAFLASEASRKRELVRFRMDDKGVRRPETGDPILNRQGKIIGFVTSCAIDQTGYLLGQAMVPDEFAEPGSTLLIYQTGGGKRPLRLPKAIKPGARMPKPDSATVLSRFPARKKG